MSKRETGRQSYWDDIAASFNGQGQHSLWRCHSDRVNGALLKHWMPEIGFGRVLKTDLFDEAVSDGLYPILGRHSSAVHGVDISARAAEAAGEKYPELKARRADLRDLPFEEGEFDTVVSNSSLDHFTGTADIRKAMGELHRVTRPGGHLLVTMDNLQNPAVWLRNHLSSDWLQKRGLVPYFTGLTLTRSGLIRFLAETGFETLDSSVIMHCPRVFSVARASSVGEKGDAAAQERFLNRLHRWERLRNWPTRNFTGYFAAVKARRLG